EKYGSLVEGRSGVESTGKEVDGWTLTPRGARWMRDHLIRIESNLKTGHPELSKKESDRFIRQMKSEALYKSFRQNSLTKESRYSFTEMLNTSPDAPKNIIVKKFKRLQSRAELVGDEEIINFLNACVKAFPEFLLEENKAESR